jgi:hypothetical protein
MMAEMEARAATLSMESLGDTRQAALRRMLTVFRDQGWHDSDGAALLVVRGVEQARGGLTPPRAAALAPAEFLARNRITRARLRDVLALLAVEGTGG